MDNRQLSTANNQMSIAIRLDFEFQTYHFMAWGLLLNLAKSQIPLKEKNGSTNDI